ncbi:muconate/chloromuconate family cycloisomerase [Uruburuella testudinis]|uniref:Muconate/chloromuconate family cycloisomerase n=1 Tax=Uruburuella testudinis TaxID=1282863 RepID=A0ABY4DPE2_9NEIS|nr:muconate/chloromuconate family cycloisomerase [Uruburuella testudinis]UOO80915.1 muconate/chloromuconate family cycloisomerase [Uruburuella testudinis]
MIKSIETLLLEVPTIRPHKLSVTTMNTQTLVLVHIMFSDGLESWGEATTIGGLNYAEESPAAIKTNIDTYIAPLLLQAQPQNTARAMQLLHTHIKGNRFAKSAIETALLDAQAKRLGTPLSELLGGAVHDALPVAWTLASGQTDQDIAEAEHMIGAGRHRIFKLKIGLNSVADDVRHVLAVKQALGSSISVRVDVNQAWTELEAMRGIAMLEDGGIDLIEQPVAAGNRNALKRLCEHFNVAIMADEAVLGPQNAFELAAGHYADVFAVKINQAGGLRNAALVGQTAALAGIELYGGTMLEGAVGTLASAHVFSTYPELAFGTELFGPLLLTEDIMTEPLPYRDFMLQLPKKPGLGIEVDKEKVYRLRTA